MPSRHVQVILVMLCATAFTALSADPARPNVVVVHTDEHNFRTLGCYRAMLPEAEAFVWGPGNAVDTPHIDSIAREGALCTSYYASSPVCTPSRASFVSGRYPQNTGADKNNLPMRADMVTFAEVLRRRGYSTGYAGKWHLDGTAKPGWTPARRFGFVENTYMFNRGHWKKLQDTVSGPRVKDGNNYSVEGADETSFTTDFLMAKTIEFIRAHCSRPFCFMVSLPDPHGPNTVRPPYDTLYKHLRFEPPVTAKGKKVSMDMAKYFGMVKCIDDNVGKLLRTLDEAGLTQNTVLVFTSDHGDMCGEHGRVNKGVPHEASARIPFVIRYPRRIQPGTVVQQALGTVDFKPTLLGLLELPADPLDEGRNAAALFLPGKAPAGWKDRTFARHAGGQWLMAVSSRYKLVIDRTDGSSLFDLEADAFEQRNLIDKPEKRAVARELATALLDYAQRYREPHADAWKEQLGRIILAR